MINMNVFLICILAFLLSIGCKDKAQTNIKGKNPIPADNTNNPPPCERFEIRELKKGVYYKIIPVSDTTYTLKWGEKGKKRFISKRLFEITGSGTLEYLTSNDNIIILAHSCGTSCTYFVILPIKNDNLQAFYHPQAINLNRNLIAYSPKDNEDNVFLIVENYITGEKTLIKETNLCPAIFKGECIECCYFDGQDLIVKWQGENWKSHNKQDINVKMIPIGL